MIFLGIYDKFPNSKQHYVIKMEDSWVAKELMAVIQDASYNLIKLDKEQKIKVENGFMEKGRALFSEIFKREKKKYVKTKSNNSDELTMMFKEL